MNHLYIFLTIAFTVYGQLVIKWQVGKAGSFPDDMPEKLLHISKLLLNPWIVSSFSCAFLAAISWIVAVSKFPLSYAYPFMSLAFVLVLLLSSALFHESITLPKVIGVGLITAGVIISSQR
jgi:multidrug transporter EmrE-like cation transporter